MIKLQVWRIRLKWKSLFSIPSFHQKLFSLTCRPFVSHVDALSSSIFHSIPILAEWMKRRSPTLSQQNVNWMLFIFWNAVCVWSYAEKLTVQGRRHKNFSAVASDVKWGIWGTRYEVWEGRHHRANVKPYETCGSGADPGFSLGRGCRSWGRRFGHWRAPLIDQN